MLDPCVEIDEVLPATVVDNDERLEAFADIELPWLDTVLDRELRALDVANRELPFALNTYANSPSMREAEAPPDPYTSVFNADKAVAVVDDNSSSSVTSLITKP